ncbi:predicted protein [Uncinocarpus reesii 1704]|uniref:Uncharacterized protein n=1 Tax=Uncinocarpus reesii (strain UAMH 1704) TaxID=336963 RepID=C4JFW0_UNCRE|nr:uncharacterized protein UREG_01040 [Uncinocarpus reesii 1704]EEP76191.1 predicted protein [Uncinocarpus reesii 1704]
MPAPRGVEGACLRVDILRINPHMSGALLTVPRVNKYGTRGRCGANSGIDSSCCRNLRLNPGHQIFCSFAFLCLASRHASASDPASTALNPCQSSHLFQEINQRGTAIKAGCSSRKAAEHVWSRQQ